VNYNPQNEIFRQPLNILQNILKQTAQRATKINDKELNKLMLRLTLYSISDPNDPEYNPEQTTKYLEL